MGNGPKSYSANASDYKLLEEIGYGASATVFRAIYLPLNDVVAIKCLDLDRCNSNLAKVLPTGAQLLQDIGLHISLMLPGDGEADSHVFYLYLDDIRKEAQTMSLIDHPNVVRAFCSFVVDRNLWVVMPFMAEGSCLHLMKTAFSDGIDESAIGSILKETLKALEYLHRHGHIHRDVKAGNVLLDTNGAVKLADFGVSACMFDSGDRKRSRNTFVGTPCWMAPEVLQPGSGYDFKADIWSFGITALELAHGHAPFSKFPPMKVLLMTIQNAPPGLDYARDKRFSKSFKEMVAMCLVKDQTKRPTAAKLLKHSFFKHAKPPEVSVKKLFAGLPPLWNRVKALQLKDAAQLALKKMPSAEEEAISQSEYKRGVSAWNFDVEDLKVQASMVQDDDEIQEMGGDEESAKLFLNDRDPSDCRSSLGKSVLTRGDEIGNELSLAGCSSAKDKIMEGNFIESGGQEKSDQEMNGPSTGLIPSTSDKDIVLPNTRTQVLKNSRSQSGPLMPGAVLGNSLPERGRILERCDSEAQQSTQKVNREMRRPPSFSGPLMLPNRASANSLSAPIKSSGGFRDCLDEKSKTNLVQIKGRFSVTSENVDLVKDIPISTVPRRSAQGSPLRKSASVGDWLFDSKQMPIGQSSKDLSISNLPASILLPHLQNLFQQTSIQQDLILNLLTTLQPAEAVEGSQNGKLPPLPRSSDSNGSAEAAATERERLLLIKLSDLQARMTNLTEELTAERLKYIQLQQQLDAVSGREEDA